MNIIVVILHGLILEVLSYQQEKCRKEKHSVKFYIYNANVNITLYPCIQTEGNATDICKNYKYTEIHDDHFDIIDKCIETNFARGTVTREGTNVYYKNDRKKIFLKLCKLTAYVELTTRKIVESMIGQRNYDDGREYLFKNQSHDVALKNHFIFWTPNICKDLNFIYNGSFDVWSLQNGQKYIRNEQISLILTESEELCSSKIWKTDYDGIIVSTQRINTLLSTNLTQKYQSSRPRDCEIAAEAPRNGLTTDQQYDFTGTEELKKEVTVTTTNDKQKAEISDLKTSVLYLILVVIVILLWYAFNVIVNFSALRTAGKKKATKSSTYLIYCVSQSLTNRYLYLDNNPVNEKNHPNNLQSLPQLYETVE